MWRQISVRLALGMALLPTPASFGQEHIEPGSLIARSNWAQLEVVLGQISVINARYGQSRNASTNLPLAGVRESLSLHVHAGVPSLHYVLTDPQQQLTVDLVGRNQVEIHREPQGESQLAAVQFSQRTGGESTLIVWDGGSQRQYRSNGLWRLILAEPDACRQHLVPILELMRPDWSLLEIAGQIEDSLFQIASSGSRLERRRLIGLIDQLGGDDFQQRQAADRQIREMGPAAMAVLEELDPRQLDAEQRLRIRNIQQAFSVPAGDTPQRVANLLSGDASVWLCFMSHPDPAKRQAATQYLARLLEEPVDFDAHGDDSQREAQIRRLRQRLDR